MRLARAWRSIASTKVKAPVIDRIIPRRQSFSDGRQSLVPAVLASFFGAGLIQVSFAEEAHQSAPVDDKPSHSPPTYVVDLEEIANNERRRIEDLLKSSGMPFASYPKFTVAVKGQKLTIKFEVPSGCEVPQLIAHIVSHLGTKVEEGGAGSHMLLHAWDSSVVWQLTLGHSEKQKVSGADHQGDDQETNGDLCILIYRSLISSNRPEIEFIKQGSLSPKEIDAFVSVLRIAGAKLKQHPTSGKGGGISRVPSEDKSVPNLESIGVRIYGLDEPHVDSADRQQISWENIAGYDQQKREIEDTILLAMHSPEVYDEIARGTRRKYESNRPRAVLFEGPPGTGKTSCARVISNQAGVPLLYVPLEVVMSKYYGESERLLGKVFALANELPNGAIIFLDEVDSFAAARDAEMHEATRRILSVLLRQIDGFEQDKKVVVIGATNRKQDLDPALISRFDSLITFDLPDEQTRKEIAAQYAKHLPDSELLELAKAMDEMSGRDIRDVCQHAERSWASKIIRGLATKDGEKNSLPPLQEYIESAKSRRKALLSVADLKTQSVSHRKKQLLDFA